MLYRELPTTVDAFQLNTEHRWDQSTWPKWLQEAWWLPSCNANAVFDAGVGGGVWINSRQGMLLVNLDDWIMQGNDGTVTMCACGSFASRYAPVDPVPKYLHTLTAGE